MEIMTESIKNQLDLLFDTYKEENLNNVESLIVNRFNSSKEPINVKYKDLLYFKNLKVLTMNDCIIDSELMSILNSLNIEKLYLFNCETFEDIERSLMSLNLDTLVLDNTELNLNSLNEINIPNLVLSNIDLPIIPINCNSLNISRINKIKNVDNLNINELIINESQYEKIKPILGNIKYIVIDSYGEVKEGE